MRCRSARRRSPSRPRRPDDPRTSEWPPIDCRVVPERRTWFHAGRITKTLSPPTSDTEAAERGIKMDKDGMVLCRVCGCTEFQPCCPPCAWVETDLCSLCAMVAEALSTWMERRPPAEYRGADARSQKEGRRMKKSAERVGQGAQVATAEIVPLSGNRPTPPPEPELKSWRARGAIWTSANRRHLLSSKHWAMGFCFVWMFQTC